MARLVKCRVCGNPIASDAKRCLSCNTQDPFGTQAALTKLLIVVGLLVGGYMMWQDLPAASALLAKIPEFIREHQ